ncbi:hypothetical protein [Lysinibacillus sp. FSL P2-0066]|uniref:hypothetical protein n=1 Tax=Lysinibacillus sp. FSL P2-0066 TaxID=2921720 RepID=UPI0030DDCF7F
MNKFGIQVYLTEGEILPYIEVEIEGDSSLSALSYLFGDSTNEFLIYSFLEGQTSFVARDKIKKIDINKY